MAYKFDDNLKDLSVPGENYKSQWLVEFYTHNTSASATDVCICQRQIKYCFFVRNSMNGNMVKMGSKCVKSILSQDVSDNANTREKMKKHIIYMFDRGLYIEINDLHEYVICVIIDYISNITSISELKQLLLRYNNNPIILPLIQNIYNKKYQEIIRDQQLEEERRQREIERNRLEEEKKRQAIDKKRILEEKQQEIRRANHEIYIQRMLKYEAEEKIRKQKEVEIQKKIDEEEREYREFQKEIKEKKKKVCECGLKCIYECTCETPIWEINKLTSNMYCKRCNMWKCRM